MRSGRRNSVDMRTSLILLGCLVGLTLQRGPKCGDGTKPTCEDGTTPVRVKGQPPCTEGRPKTCADGSEPSFVKPVKPVGTKGKCDDGSRPTCADGSFPSGGGGLGKCRRNESLCCDGTDLTGQGRRPKCDDGEKPVCSEDQC